MLVDLMNTNRINNKNELKLRASICKHVEKNDMYVTFSEKFHLNNITDNIIINILDNIENMALTIGGGYFIIIHRVSDNKIFKREIAYRTYYESDENKIYVSDNKR